MRVHIQHIVYVRRGVYVSPCILPVQLLQFFRDVSREKSARRAFSGVRTRPVRTLVGFSKGKQRSRKEEEEEEEEARRSCSTIPRRALSSLFLSYWLQRSRSRTQRIIKRIDFSTEGNRRDNNNDDADDHVVAWRYVQEGRPATARGRERRGRLCPVSRCQPPKTSSTRATVVRGRWWCGRPRRGRGDGPIVRVLRPVVRVHATDRRQARLLQTSGQSQIRDCRESLQEGPAVALRMRQRDRVLEPGRSARVWSEFAILSLVLGKRRMS